MNPLIQDLRDMLTDHVEGYDVLTDDEYADVVEKIADLESGMSAEMYKEKWS